MKYHSSFTATELKEVLKMSNTVSQKLGIFNVLILRFFISTDL